MAHTFILAPYFVRHLNLALHDTIPTIHSQRLGGILIIYIVRSTQSVSLTTQQSQLFTDNATGSMERDENYVPMTRSQLKMAPANEMRRSHYAKLFEETPLVSLIRLIGFQLAGIQVYLTFNVLGSPQWPSGTNVSHDFVAILGIFLKATSLALASLLPSVQKDKPHASDIIKQWTRDLGAYVGILDLSNKCLDLCQLFLYPIPPHQPLDRHVHLGKSKTLTSFLLLLTEARIIAQSY